MLVEAGASLTRTDYQGNTPRLQALRAEDKELAAYLESKPTSLLHLLFNCVFVYERKRERMVQYRVCNLWWKVTSLKKGIKINGIIFTASNMKYTKLLLLQFRTYHYMLCKAIWKQKWYFSRRNILYNI